METTKNIVFSTPLLCVLDLLLEYSGENLTDTEIVEKIIKVKKSAIHKALVQLADMGVVTRTRVGRRISNAINFEHAWLTPLKIAGNILELSSVVEKLQKISSKIVLFGSRARGANRHDSDYDLLVVARDSETVRQAVKKMPESDKIQFIIKTPEEMLDFETNEPVFAKNIREGIVLWEK